MTNRCAFHDDTCAERECGPARLYAAQSTDQGKTVTHVWVCDAHASGWNEGGDWDAPVMVNAADVREGDLIDLEGDAYADPKGEHPEFAYSFIEVVEVERETDKCVAIGFEGFDIVGFPPDHMLRIQV